MFAYTSLDGALFVHGQLRGFLFFGLNLILNSGNSGVILGTHYLITEPHAGWCGGWWSDAPGYPIKLAMQIYMDELAT